ncbi:MAG: helix-turn-helix transcriptional regulator [Saprospiraceae bacterium]|nr:helix-turn-helix transcriptional regulator [Saprospiraceae bacterium]
MKFDVYIPRKLVGLSPMIWEQTSDSPQHWKLLPDGHLDLIFRFDKPWTIYSETYTSKSYNPTEKFCFLSGLQTKPINVSFSQTHEIGVRLNAIAVKLMFDFPCSELVDWAINGEDILAKDIGMMEDAIRALPDFHSRAIWLENFVHSIIKDHADFDVAMRLSRLLDQAVTKKINRQPVDICSLSGYSRMHTYRLFNDWFGLPPSQAIAMKQFIFSLEQMHQEHETLTQVALMNGYYDQPHFVRAFKEYAEMTPGQYLKNRTHIVGQLPF